LLERLGVDCELELGQTLFELCEARAELARAHAVLARRRVQRLDARLGFAQRLRVELDARGVVAQVPHRLSRLRFGRLEQLDHGFQIRIVLIQGPQPARHGRELGQRRALGLGERLERGLGAGEEAGAVRKARMLGRDEIPLAFAQAQLSQLGHLVLDLGAFGLARGKILLGFQRQPLQPLPVAERLGARARQRLRVGVRVEHLPLGGRTKEGLVRMLAVDVDQELADLLQLRERRAVPVDEAAGAPGAIDGAPEEKAAGVALQVVFLCPCANQALIGKFKLGRQLCALGALPHHGRVRAPADQELDRIDEDRLAGAGLAGEHRESGLELEARGLHDHEIADLERAQH
jgi:hypothetical protein